MKLSGYQTWRLMSQTRKATNPEVKQALERVAQANDADILDLDALFIISEQLDGFYVQEEFWDILTITGIAIDACAEAPNKYA